MIKNKRLLSKYLVIAISVSLLTFCAAFLVTHLINQYALDPTTRTTRMIYYINKMLVQFPYEERLKLKAEMEKVDGFKFKRTANKAQAEADATTGPHHMRSTYNPIPGTNEYLSMYPPDEPPVHFRKRFIINFVILFVSILVSVSFSIMYVMSALRNKARIAEDVLHALQRGDLKARLPEGKNAEFAELSERFNLMAGEIEDLVEHLRQVESTRKNLMKELAHDLRTPIASLKNLIETLANHGDKLLPEKRDELFVLAIREIDYFSGLVDDLLFLGEVYEPKYRENSEAVDICSILETEAEGLAHRYPEIEFSISGGESGVGFKGDRKLLHRLFRNGLENAFSFASQKVNVQLICRAEGMEVVIEDDGQGMEKDKMKNFGLKRPERRLGVEAQKRISVGLGAVIMKRIVDLYRGTLDVSNRHPHGFSLKIFLRR